MHMELSNRIAIGSTFLKNTVLAFPGMESLRLVSPVSGTRLKKEHVPENYIIIIQRYSKNEHNNYYKMIQVLKQVLHFPYLYGILKGKVRNGPCSGQ